MKMFHRLVLSALAAAPTVQLHAQGVPQKKAAEVEPARPDAQRAYPILADIFAPIPNGGVWHPSVPPGMKIIDGDMLVPLSFNPETDGFYNTNLWSGGTVPYTFDSAFTAAESSQIVTAMNAWTAVSNVSFVVRGSQTDYVYIQRSTVNNSSIGHVGGQQIINFAPNQSQRVYIHELGHCLGFLHEHQRGDRGAYITVNQSNAQAAFYGANFPIISSGAYWGPYDFASIMHYDRCAFSTACSVGATCNCASNQETMTATSAFYSTWNSVMGNANTQSYIDKVTMRGLYPFSLDRWMDATWFGTQSGTLQAPWNQSFPGAVTLMPSGGNLFFKSPASYSALGTYSKPMTIDAPGGTVTLGN